VPHVDVKSKNIKPDDGLFQFKKWRMEVDKSLLDSPTLPPKKAKALMNTTYHEARHAEQWFTAAQSQAAAPGATGPGVATAMGIPPNVGNAAAAKPLPANSSPPAVLGQAVNQSVYGSGRAQREKILKHTGSKTGYARYRGLPEEQDAWRTGDGTDACP